MGSLSSSSTELKPSGVRKGAWCKEEDDLLRKCIEKYGEGKWSLVPGRAGLKRCRKSCRLRWLNYLSPAIHRGKFSDDEVDLIVRLHKLLGNRWSLIAGRIPGRTANDIKNYWNSHSSKKPADAQHEKKLEQPIASTANVGSIHKPQPQRVSKTWMWPENSGKSQHYGPIEPPRPPTTTADQDESWLNELMNVGREAELADHDQFPRTDSLSSLDFYLSCEVEEAMDEALLLGGIKEWDNICLEH